MSRGRFTPDQVERLLRPIKEGRVYKANGQSHVAGWDITAHLTRMFGFGGWEKEILDLVLVAEEHAPEWSGKKNWFVTYRCTLRLRIFDPDRNVVVEIDDVGTGTSPNLPSRGDAHDFAVKNAVTYALKRCAKDLGDQFGLSLYHKGYAGPVVGMTLVDGPEKSAEPDVTVAGEGDDHEPPDGVDPDTGEVTTDQADQADDDAGDEDVVPDSVAAEWINRMTAIDDEVVRKAFKNRFVAEFGDPRKVPTINVRTVDAWLDTEFDRLEQPMAFAPGEEPALSSEAF